MEQIKQFFITKSCKCLIHPQELPGSSTTNGTSEVCIVGSIPAVFGLNDEIHLGLDMFPVFGAGGSKIL